MMKARFFYFTILYGLLLTAVLGGVASANIVVFDNSQADNDWNNPLNWFDTATALRNLPTAADNALVNSDGLADFFNANSAFSPSQLWVSNNLGGSINISGDFTANSGIIIGLGGQSTNPAVITQTAGNVIGTGFVAVAGAAGNAPASPSVYEISGGSLSTGFLNVGSFGFGTLKIDGSAASVSVSGGTAVFGVGATLDFVLDATGVSPLTAMFTNNHLTGSTLTVDGSAYTGGPATIPLVLTDGTDNPFAITSASGFTNLNATIVQSGGDVELRLVAAIPEPGTALLSSLGLAVMFVAKPQRRK